ncbi:acyl-[acyl-carrier-protein] thioesterase [Streptococcus gallolyticus]|uniref:acyl-ACP thioesterase domain-containing protein n=1 Tax=Streptococcus hepaticus TaxID=3349163 RepID=UPI001C97F208|nr:acyl-[acyl-carrier-protein] thioesterase [Streptococcus gallolyticus]MBY5041224.1 acyl-[acyl-carrier-protein] thioesterase [Streptococcus gallolyticus]
MGLSYQEDYTIPFDIVDVKREVKLPHLILRCLEISGRQSSSLGRSDRYIFETYGLVWVVTDYEFTIHRLPHYGETVTIATEALSHNKFFCYRKFFIYDAEGDLLMDILCYFVLLGLESRKLSPVPEDLVAPFESEMVKKVQRAPKLPVLEDLASQEYRIRYFDIDMNGHVNNSKYLEWMFDVLDYDFLLYHVPKRLQLKYIKEVAPGGMIDSQYRLDGLTSQHAIVSEGELRAQAQIEWRKVDDEG